MTKEIDYARSVRDNKIFLLEQEIQKLTLQKNENEKISAEKSENLIKIINNQSLKI